VTSTPFAGSDLPELQTAFIGLLAHPLVTPWTFPDIYRLVTRHQQRLDLWCRRLGYHLLRIDRCYRLHRVPLAGRLAVPRGLPLGRRALVLALLVAAIVEDERQDSITLQDISDAVRRFAFVNEFRPYDPEQWRQRADLVEAVRLLVGHGVLEQRTQRADLLESWEREHKGIGAGYVIHRDALVLFVDTRHTELAALDAPDATTRGQRILRQLVETQALDIAGLTPDETAYLVTQRPRLVELAQEMTGGTVEVRSDAWILVLPSDQGLDPATLVGFPEATAAAWVALGLLDAAVRVAEEAGTRRHLDSAAVDALTESLYSTHRNNLTVSLRESPAAVRAAAEQQLRGAGLLEIDAAGDWWLLAAAGRYRDAALETPSDPGTTTTQTTLFEVNDD